MYEALAHVCQALLNHVAWPMHQMYAQQLAADTNFCFAAAGRIPYHWSWTEMATSEFRWLGP